MSEDPKGIMMAEERIDNIKKGFQNAIDRTWTKAFIVGYGMPILSLWLMYQDMQENQRRAEDRADAFQVRMVQDRRHYENRRERDWQRFRKERGWDIRNPRKPDTP